MPPSPLLAVAAVLAVTVAVGLVARYRGRAHYADPDDDAETAYHLRRLRRRSVAAGWTLTAALAYWLELGPAIRSALEPASGSPAVAGTVLAYGLPAVAVAVAVRLATVPYQRAVRGLHLRYRDAAAWELERDGVGLVGVLGAAAVIALAPAGWPRVLATVGLGVIATALAPFALVIALQTRWPTDAERERIGDALPDGIRLRVVDDRTRVGSAFAAGFLPRAKYVFLTESLFDVLDDAELRAVVAHEVGHHEREHVLLRFSTAAVAAGAAVGVASYAPSLALWGVLAGAIPFALATAWVVRRTEHAADAYAAEVVSGPALASALATLAERRYVMDASGPFQVLSYHPPLAERIEGLRRECEAVGPSTV